MRVWVEFFSFLIKFFILYFLFYFIYFLLLDLYFVIGVPIEEDDELDFVDAVSDYGIYENINSNFDTNLSEREADYETYMCRVIDNFNHNYIFPIYNYFYPSRDPGYSLFFDSKFGIVVALLEFAVEDIGTDMIFVGSLVVGLFSS